MAVGVLMCDPKDDGTYQLVGGCTLLFYSALLADLSPLTINILT